MAERLTTMCNQEVPGSTPGWIVLSSSRENNVILFLFFSFHFSFWHFASLNHLKHTKKKGVRSSRDAEAEQPIN